MRPIRLHDALRARLARADALRIPLGADAVDSALGGGLKRAGLHEVFAGDDRAAGGAFALMLALIAAARDRPLLWVRCDRTRTRLHAPGLAELGADPDSLLIVAPDDGDGVLRAADDIVRHGGAGAAVVEIDGRAPRYDLTASRRLALAATRSDMCVLVVRCGATPVPSAAETRWQVAPAPSSTDPLFVDAPGAPTFDINLLRQRGGIAGIDARLEWNRDSRNFAPLSGSLSAFPPDRAHRRAA